MSHMTGFNEIQQASKSCIIISYFQWLFYHFPLKDTIYSAWIFLKSKICSFPFYFLSTFQHFGCNLLCKNPLFSQFTTKQQIRRYATLSTHHCWKHACLIDGNVFVLHVLKSAIKYCHRLNILCIQRWGVKLAPVSHNANVLHGNRVFGFNGDIIECS